MPFLFLWKTLKLMTVCNILDKSLIKLPSFPTVVLQQPHTQVKCRVPGPQTNCLPSHQTVKAQWGRLSKRSHWLKA